MLIMWAAKWISVNPVDGRRQHLLHENLLPCLFKTRAAARAYIQKKYGYVATRPDLRAEPHGWRMPQAVRVEIAEVR